MFHNSKSRLRRFNSQTRRLLRSRRRRCKYWAKEYFSPLISLPLWAIRACSRWYFNASLALFIRRLRKLEGIRRSWFSYVQSVRAWLMTPTTVFVIASALWMNSLACESDTSGNEWDIKDYRHQMIFILTEILIDRCTVASRFSRGFSSLFSSNFFSYFQKSFQGQRVNALGIFHCLNWITGPDGRDKKLVTFAFCLPTTFYDHSNDSTRHHLSCYLVMSTKRNRCAVHIQLYHLLSKC